MTEEQNADPSGSDLKTARENSGLTLKDLFERTRISVVNLEAMENGDFHLLPVPIYTRNFIKTYADTLGVDSKPVLQRYENYLQALQLEENSQQTKQAEKASAGQVMSQYKTYVWIISIVIVFVGVSFFVSLYNKPEPEVPQATEPNNEAAAPEVKLPITVQPENRPAIDLPVQPENTAVPRLTEVETKQPQPPKAKPQSDAMALPAASNPEAQKNEARRIAELLDSEEAALMSIRATEETWVRIKADDQEPFQVLLKPGEKISHKGARFSMDIGNAAGVKIQFNGKTFENLGKSGQVIHLRFP
jgi:cytoskeletal protein RodZ